MSARPASASHLPNDAGTADPASAADDGALLDRLRSGDEQAFVDLVERYHGSLVRVALGFVSSRAAAEEVVQDTWVGVLKGLPTFEGRASVKTWIFRILSNRAKTRGARDKRSVPFSDLAGEADDEPSVDPSRFKENGMWGEPPKRWEAGAADRFLMNREALEQLEHGLAKLPPGQRAVVTLRDIEGLDAAEVCNVLDISETNQRVLLHRGRSKLRALLEAYVERT